MLNSRDIPNSGNKLIDHQHGRLTELIQAATQCARGEIGDFTAAVHAFRTMLADHFAVEGVIFRGAGFPGSSAHETTHAIILSRVDDVVKDLPNLDRASERHGVIDEMERILFDHELVEDSAYWESLRQHSDHPALVWDDSLGTGLSWVDDQHRHLVALINELGRVAPLPRQEIAIAELMERFLRHARQHFAAEERQLDDWNLPVSAHRAEHVRLLEEVENLAMAVGSNPAILVNHYLKFWMLDHIRGADMQDFAGRS